jgi:hypothetical protein
MYKHLITYRYRIDSSQISSVKKLEIIAEERISMDGPGIWKTKCKNFISAKTGINASQVIDNEHHFRIDFTGNASDNSSSNGNSKNEANPEVEIRKAEARKAEAEASARKAEAKSQERANLMNNLFNGLNADANEVKEKTDYISKIVLSNDVEELTNQLNEISSLWGTAKKFTNSDHEKAVKKSAYEKFEFGIMKLEQIGTPTQIEFFKKKLIEMKPKKFFGLF